jgi:lipopolysaccharide/colanic/teichoic acid biosynthesis glycosyltransferase
VTRRAVDLLVAGAALAVALVPGLFIALLVKLTSRGPVIFRQERLGLHGRRFRLFKFRSMVADAERILSERPDLLAAYVASGYKLPAGTDPRITRVGAFLRRTSLDEIPQLWNVLRGDMTLVGPRPIVPPEIARYGPHADVLLSVKPGLTGVWQVAGRSAVPAAARTLLDLEYALRRSWRLDLGILMRTIPAVLRRRGAH